MFQTIFLEYKCTFLESSGVGTFDQLTKVSNTSENKVFNLQKICSCKFVKIMSLFAFTIPCYLFAEPKSNNYCQWK